MWSQYIKKTNNEDIKAVREDYDNHKTVATKIIITFFSLLLTLNKLCLQLHKLFTINCAMGTLCAPGYINFFMAQFEK